MFLEPEKNTLASNEIINRSAKIKNNILITSTPEKVRLKPTRPVTTVSIKKSTILFFIFFFTKITTE